MGSVQYSLLAIGKLGRFEQRAIVSLMKPLLPAVKPEASYRFHKSALVPRVSGECRWGGRSLERMAVGEKENGEKGRTSRMAIGLTVALPATRGEGTGVEPRCARARRVRRTASL